MGTSTSYAGSPKWGTVKGQVTRAAAEGPLTSQKAASSVRAFVKAIAGNNVGGFGSSRSGGSGTGSGGGGRTGLHERRVYGGVRGAAAAVGQFIRDVQKQGLRETLRLSGYSEIENLSPTDLVLVLSEVLGGGDSTIDGADLQNALCELLRDLLEGAATLDTVEFTLKGAGGKTEQIIRSLIGNYIFERYNTTFSSGLETQLSVSQVDCSMEEVKRFIDTEVQLKGTVRDLSDVDWNGSEGEQIVDEILRNTIDVFRENV